jgi:hypothetical protein
MPIIKSNSNLEKLLSDSLIESGIDAGKYELAGPKREIDLNPENELIRTVLNENGATVDDASQTIAEVMSTARFESTRLKAAELVLDLHGIRDTTGKLRKQPIFNFHINDAQVNIANIFAPHTDRRNRQVIDATVEKE